MSEFIGVREAARRLAVHENTVRNWVAKGMLADVRVPGSSFVRLKSSEIDGLDEARRTREEPDPILWEAKLAIELHILAEQVPPADRNELHAAASLIEHDQGARAKNYIARWLLGLMEKHGLALPRPDESGDDA